MKWDKKASMQLRQLWTSTVVCVALPSSLTKKCRVHPFVLTLPFYFFLLAFTLASLISYNWALSCRSSLPERWHLLLTKPGAIQVRSVTETGGAYHACAHISSYLTSFLHFLGAEKSNQEEGIMVFEKEATHLLNANNLWVL